MYRVLTDGEVRGQVVDSVHYGHDGKLFVVFDDETFIAFDTVDGYVGPYESRSIENKFEMFSDGCDMGTLVHSGIISEDELNRLWKAYRDNVSDERAGKEFQEYLRLKAKFEGEQS